MPKETLLVVLGAGASFDAIPDSFSDDTTVRSEGLEEHRLFDVRPPLANDLARARPLQNEILAKWEGARPVVEFLRSHLAGGTPDEQALSLEGALSKYEADGARVSEHFTHLHAFRFYLRDLLWATGDYMNSPQLTVVTNHDALLRLLHNWATEDDNRRVCIASFNYDLILERAAGARLGFEFTSPDTYLRHPTIKIVKPHGSVQWAWRVRSEKKLPRTDPYAYGSKSISFARTEGVDDSTIVTVPFAAHKWRYDRGLQEGLIPALALPIANKSEFVWPEVHKEYLYSLVRDTVTRVLTIGWRGLEPLFLTLINGIAAGSDTRVQIVTGGPEGDRDARAIEERIRAVVQIGQSNRVPDGFTGFLANSSSAEWLLN